MRIQLMALCFGLALTPGVAVTAHATYTAIVLPDLGGASNSVVEAINSVGESVGYSVTPNGGLDAVMWSADGATGTVLLDKGGQGQSNAFAINASGESVGQTVAATGEDARICLYNCYSWQVHRPRGGLRANAVRSSIAL